MFDLVFSFVCELYKEMSWVSKQTSSGVILHGLCSRLGASWWLPSFWAPEMWLHQEWLYWLGTEELNGLSQARIWFSGPPSRQCYSHLCTHLVTFPTVQGAEPGSVVQGRPQFKRGVCQTAPAVGGFLLRMGVSSDFLGVWYLTSFTIA